MHIILTLNKYKYAYNIGGTVLYHNQPNTLQHTLSLSVSNDNKENQRNVINTFISSVLLGEGKNKNATTDDNDGPRREILTLGNN